LGLGLKYHINKDFDLGADIFLRNLNSDKLDAVVNNNENDKYMLLALGLTYHMGKRNAKPYDRTEPTKVLYDQLLAMQSKLDSLTKDTDGDGVADLYDKDNNTPPNATVDTKGKVVDTDKDGVADEMDKDVFSNKMLK
jgi:OOP family OmpA-OmpF porin